MDEVDAAGLLNGKHGPTAIQVAAGAYAGFLYGCHYPNLGCHYPESL